MRGAGGDGDDESVDLLRDHDAIRDLVRPCDVVEHAEVAFEHERVAGLALAAGKAVDGKLADGDAVIVMLRLLAFAGDVVLRERVFTDESATLAYIELPGEVHVVGELVLRQMHLVRQRTVRLRHFGVILQKPQQSEHKAAMPLTDALTRRLIALDIAAILLGEWKSERTRIGVHIVLVVGNVSDRQGAHQRVEMLRIVATPRLEHLWSGETTCFEIVKVAEVVFAVIARRRLGQAMRVLRILGQTKQRNQDRSCSETPGKFRHQSLNELAQMFVLLFHSLYSQRKHLLFPNKTCILV